jgi:hypothetical protein
MAQAGETWRATGKKDRPKTPPRRKGKEDPPDDNGDDNEENGFTITSEMIRGKNK